MGYSPWGRKESDTTEGTNTHTHTHTHTYLLHIGFPGGGAIGKESSCQCRRHRDPGLISGLGRLNGEGNSNPVFLKGNPMDRGPGGLPSMGSHRVGHDGAINTFQRVTEATCCPQRPPHWQLTQFHHLLSPSVAYILFCRQGRWTCSPPFIPETPFSTTHTSPNPLSSGQENHHFPPGIHTDPAIS